MRLDNPPARYLLSAMRIVLALFLASLAALRAGAQPAPVWDQTVFSSVTFGAFCQLVTVDSVPAPDTAAQRVDLLPVTPDIRWPGTRIPALEGISFGVRTETIGGAVIDPVLVELTHPPFHESGTTRQSYLTVLGGSGASINAYSFDLPEELVTGTWTLQAFHDGQLLYHVRFEVVAPAQAPGIGTSCGSYLGS